MSVARTIGLLDTMTQPVGDQMRSSGEKRGKIKRKEKR
jgi:hypothetical protein